MRTEIVHIGAGELTYEIRNIVNVGRQIEAMGQEVNWENIGDPVAKGENIPAWMKEIVAEAVMDDATYAYCPTRGVQATREYLAEKTNRRGHAQISAEDILFFNGLGDAISKIFGFLRRTARVLVPTPSYSTHSSAEAAHAGHSPLTYDLDPNNHWYPDLDDIEKKVKYNPQVAGILLINPDNPTGAVYPPEILRAIVDIAKRYDLFLVCDEIYQNLIYNGAETLPLSDVIDDVPAIVMRGISKELPWPGARCGWIEVYNSDKDEMFSRYVSSILNAKMVEVCSTTLPQTVFPKIMESPHYEEYLTERRGRYEKRSRIACDALKGVEGVVVNRPNGAFYMSVCFEDGLLNAKQSLHIEHDGIRNLVESLVNVPGTAPDKRFVYYMLGATGICVVPLTSFATEMQGFRITLLENNEEIFTRIFQTVADSIRHYLAS